MLSVLRVFYAAAWFVVTYTAQPVCYASGSLSRLKGRLDEVRIPSPIRRHLEHVRAGIGFGGAARELLNWHTASQK